MSRSSPIEAPLISFRTRYPVFFRLTFLYFVFCNLPIKFSTIFIDSPSARPLVSNVDIARGVYKKCVLMSNRQHQCPICEKCYSHESSLVYHMRFHNGCDLIQCDMCDKQFARHRDLMRHMVVHTKVKSYQCYI